MTSKPNSLRHLDDAIRRASDGTPEGYVRLRTLMANAIIAQMIPDGSIKGGSAIKMRFGNESTRFTIDLDTVTEMAPESYVAILSAKLNEGWEGFTGRVVAREPAHPKDVPPEYVMQPYDVKLSYCGRSWCTVPLEVGHEEIGDTEVVDWVEQTYVSKVLERMGFSPLGRAPLMPLTHQVAQKLHAVTSGGDRVRDLIDLQLIVANADIDIKATRKICKRLFAYRKSQPWPPVVSKRDGWDELYEAQAKDLPVLQTVDDAVKWTNELISTIDRAC